MFQLIIRLYRQGRILRDISITGNEKETRTQQVMHTLEEGCERLDLAKPIWLKANVADFKRRARCRFTQDNFIEEIPFDYMEIEAVEDVEPVTKV